MCAVDGQKVIGGGKGRPFVPVDKGMVLSEALSERGGFFDQIGVVAGLEAIEHRFNKASLSA